MARKTQCGSTVATGINLKNIMLNEKDKSQKVTYYMIPLIWNV